MNVFRYEKHFLPRIERAGNGCWNWIGAMYRNGYGRMTYRNKGALVHRFSYEWHNGPIPSGMQIDHLCRNRSCCNPEHLEAVTPRENTLRGATLVAANLAKTHCHRGHPLSGDNLRLAGRRRICRECFRLHQKKFRNTDEFRASHAEYERMRRSRGREL